MADGPRIVRERVLDADADGGDRYRLHERLGAGTTGAVFRATDAELAREVAIKVLVDAGDAARWLEVEARGIDPIDRGWREQVLAPFLRELMGERGALARACERVLAAEGDRDADARACAR